MKESMSTTATHTEEAMNLRDRAVRLDEVIVEIPTFMIQQLVHIPCQDHSKVSHCTYDVN